MAELARLRCAGEEITLHEALAADVPAIVALLADDPLGATREQLADELPEAYWKAFEAVAADPGQLLVVAQAGSRVIATLQLGVIPGLARQGATRAQIEGVRVDADHRGRGLGRLLIGWAIDEARRRGCVLVQLTSDKRRPDAHRFYERLGFVASHEGFKLSLAGE